MTRNSILHHLQHDSKLWFIFYKIFWGKVRDKFEPEGMWKIGGSNLMVAIVLLQFQRFFLSQLAATFDLTIGKIEGNTTQKRGDSALKEYTTVVDNYLSKFQKKHFEKKFEGSANSPKGRKNLTDYFNTVFLGNSTNNHPVFKQFTK